MVRKRSGHRQAAEEADAGGKARVEPHRPVVVPVPTVMPVSVARELIHKLLAFVGVLLPDGTLIEANETALRAGGLDASDVLGRKFWDCYWWSHDAGEQERLRDAVQRCAAGETVRYEPTVRMAGGHLITIDFMLAPLLNARGRVTHLIPSGTDISEEVVARQQLLQQANIAQHRLDELETIYRSAPVGLCVLDREMRWQRINHRLAEINGYPPEAHIGKRVRELLPHLADTAEPMFQRVLDTGEPLLDVELVGQTPAHPGVTRTWRESFVPLHNARGEVVGVNVICREITQEKQAREDLERALALAEQRRNELESIFAVSPAGLNYLDADLHIRYVSPRMQEINGVSSETLLREGPGVLDPALVRQVHPRLEHVVQTGETLNNIQHTWTPPYDPARPHHFLANYAPVRGESDKPAGVMVAVVDVTELAEQREQLASLNTSLERQVEQRTRMLAEQNRRLAAMSQEIMAAQNRERRRISKILHDDLQQTLSAAYLEADLLAAKQTDPQHPLRILRDLLKEAAHSARDLSHELYPSVLTTHGLPEALRWLAGEFERRFRLKIECDCDGFELALSSQCRGFLYDVARELLFNVHKHAKTDRAFLALRPCPQGCLLEVKDHGKGCDPSHLVPSDQRRRSLGLPMIYHRLALLGGSIQADGQAGKGCHITVILPASAISEAEEEE